MEGKYDRAILNTLCAIAENLNPSGPAAVTFYYAPLATSLNACTHNFFIEFTLT
jgi:hypothetical protein